MVRPWDEWHALVAQLRAALGSEEPGLYTQSRLRCITRYSPGFPSVRTSQMNTRLLLVSLMSVCASAGCNEDITPLACEPDSTETECAADDGSSAERDSTDGDDTATDAGSGDAGRDDAGSMDDDVPPLTELDVDVCEPDCRFRDCGPDGCGGTCGTCATDAICDDGVCIDVPSGDLGCVDIVDCINFCETEGCGTECYESGRPESQALFADVYECIVRNCADFAGDPEAYGDCQYEFCYPELEACFEDE